MPYYSDEFLEEVRSRSDIVDVIGSYVKLKKSGSTHMGLCPFHNEKTPSFSVTQSKQLFYCFGCHVGGSVFTFIEQYENCSFSEAVEFLANRAGIAIPETRGSREEKARNDLKAALLQINREAGAYYYYQLRSPAGAQGMEYLKNRNARSTRSALTSLMKRMTLNPRNSRSNEGRMVRRSRIAMGVNGYLRNAAVPLYPRSFR